MRGGGGEVKGLDLMKQMTANVIVITILFIVKQS